MKYLVLSLLMIGVGIGVVGCDDDDDESQGEEKVEDSAAVDESEDPTFELNPPYVASVTGLFQTVANPPLSLPPLPCLVGAIVSGEDEYILTSNGYWFCGGYCSWNGVELKDDDAIIVNGTVSEDLDVYDRVFVLIEIDQLQVVTNTPPSP